MKNFTRLLTVLGFLMASNQLVFAAQKCEKTSDCPSIPSHSCVRGECSEDEAQPANAFSVSVSGGASKSKTLHLPVKAAKPSAH